MQGKILSKAWWWTAASVLMGFSFVLAVIWMIRVTVVAAIGGLVLKERGNA